MKVIKVSNKCVASGSCTLLTDLLQEGPDGKATPVGTGKITDKTAEKFMGVINHCPVGAISLEDSSIVKSTGTHGLKEIKTLITKELVEFKVPRPSEDICRYRGSASSIHYISAEGHNRYDYRSDSQAESAGLSHFDRIAYSQRRALVQEALVEFKVNQLGDFIKYETKQGNYYNDINEYFINFIRDVLKEIDEKTDGKIKLSLDLDRLKIGPDHHLNKVEDDFYLYQLHNIELIFTDSVVNKLNSLSSYKIYINTDDMEDYRERDVYCYNLFEVIEEFRGDIASAIQDVFNYDDAIKVHIERVYETYSKILKEELNEIAKFLFKEIDNYLVVTSK
ncbi:ferredoxin [Fictibacillus iocasae]|uniref:Ferredoxin n=1 Tax=Fictibacillus iocasae TaxID=2715437 RepID=A0ABW2NQ09_9BACL